ncbi:hypothetical protein ANCDUO_14583 [Ancylostoma duodenale]|uniref:Uncharacterized protein n=1 Tax=Ancylostoma duodenale TaxID=51022 RepID=A0A0C2CFY6_9BILA|nr:hypothetical protein ANCDUO_14583 [Ancylostoma duodenale]
MNSIVTRPRQGKRAWHSIIELPKIDPSDRKNRPAIAYLGNWSSCQGMCRRNGRETGPVLPLRDVAVLSSGAVRPS